MLRYIIYSVVFLAAAFSGMLALEIYTNSVSAFFNKARPYFIEHGGQDCLKELDNRGVNFTSLGDAGTPICPVYNAVRVKSFSQTKISGPLMLTCPTAIKVDEWMVRANARFVEHIGSYNCRKARFSRIASEHSYGTAIDVKSIDGASVREDWGKETVSGKKLKTAFEEGCQIFNNALGPEYNRLHEDHFHFDLGFGFGCKLNDFLVNIYRGIRNR